MKPSRLHSLRAQGFDQSYRVRTGQYRVACSQCEALVINGMACHETGCSHDRHECAGCNALIPINQHWCHDCQ